MTHQSRIYTGGDAGSRIRRRDEIIQDANVLRDSRAVFSGRGRQGRRRYSSSACAEAVCPQMPEGAGQEEAETEDSICLGLNGFPSSPTWSSG